MDNNGVKYFIQNGKLLSTEVQPQVPSSKGRVVYEVIRVIDGVPLFLEDHYQRMIDSMRMLGIRILPDLTESEKPEAIPDDGEILDHHESPMTLPGLKDEIRRLGDIHSLVNFNVRLEVYEDEGAVLNRVLRVSPSHYPDAETIERGVPVGLITLERQNPNAKVVNASYKEKVERKMAEDGVFEVLLVDGDNRITEGSRSNVFFIKGGKAFTAPGEAVLKGITRQYVLEACRRAGVEVVEEMVSVADLGLVTGVFLSGTSIKVLPVSSIEKMAYSSSAHEQIKAIGECFEEVLREYIRGNR